MRKGQKQLGKGMEGRSKKGQNMDGKGTEEGWEREKRRMVKRDSRRMVKRQMVPNRTEEGS